MADLFHQLGIDWRLLLSQAVNFLLLLTVLRLFAYKPILKILHDRQNRIQEGLDKAKEADLRLDQANEMTKEKMKQAEQDALGILRDTESRSKEMEAKLLEAAHEKEAAVLQNAELIIAGKAEEARRKMRDEAAQLVRDALVRTVELDPKSVDETLIKKAVAGIVRK